jgi:glycerol uptake facilitator-like aquaporin
MTGLFMLKRWWLREAEWWQFWLPQSGPIGGGIGGTLLGTIVFIAHIISERL